MTVRMVYFIAGHLVSRVFFVTHFKYFRDGARSYASLSQEWPSIASRLSLKNEERRKEGSTTLIHLLYKCQPPAACYGFETEALLHAYLRWQWAFLVLYNTCRFIEHRQLLCEDSSPVPETQCRSTSFQP